MVALIIYCYVTNPPKIRLLTLAGVAQCIEGWSVKQRVTGSFPVMAHAWIAGQAPSRRYVRGNHTLIFLPSLSPSKISK